MKPYLLFLMVILTAIMSLGRISAQNLVITLDDGSETSVPVTDVQKLTFDLNDLILAFKSGQTNNYPLPEIKKLSFDMTVDIEKLSGNPEHKTIISPNPALETVFLHNIPADCQTIRLFNMDGRLLMTVPVTGTDRQLSLTAVKPGLYFMSLNGQSFKLVKQ